MIKALGGSIINMSSISYMMGNAGYPSYVTANSGINGMTRALAREFGSYNIRVNAISAGPIKTLAASGVKNFRKMLSQHSKRAPLGRTVTAEEVGNVAAFLCSNHASGITGEITYVDAGFNISAMPLNDIDE